MSILHMCALTLQKDKLISKLRVNDHAAVFVQNIPFGFTEINIRRYFNQFGRVLRCRMGKNARVS